MSRIRCKSFSLSLCLDVHTHIHFKLRYNLVRDENTGEWLLKSGSDGEILLVSKSKFEPTPISVAKWGYWKKKGKERKFVISFAATIVESRIPIPAHNRHHWCAIARTGLTRGRVFELERQGASTKVIEQAEHDFEDAKDEPAAHIDEPELGIDIPPSKDEEVL